MLTNAACTQPDFARRVKAAKTRMRRYAQRCWKARLKPKVDCKRNQMHVYNHAAVWTRLSGGHGGAGSFATKKRREHQQQQGNLADVLQNTLNQWMQSQRAPKRQKATAQDCCSDTSLLSILEATLADCKKHKRDDMAVANAVQEALTSHQQERQTFYPKDALNNWRHSVVSYQGACRWLRQKAPPWTLESPNRLSTGRAAGAAHLRDTWEELFTGPAAYSPPIQTFFLEFDEWIPPPCLHLGCPT